MSLLTSRLAPRIVEEDGAFRTRMLGIAAGMNNLIALGRGDSDFHTPAHIVEAAKAALDDNQHHYTGPTGILPLREAISDNLSSVLQFLAVTGEPTSRSMIAGVIFDRP